MITKFKTFENDHSDIDPYNEEEWNETKIIEEGDDVELMDNIKVKWLTMRFVDSYQPIGSKGKVIAKQTSIDGFKFIFVDFDKDKGWYDQEKFIKV